MNPLLKSALASLARRVFTVAATYVVATGAWTDGDAEKYVTAGSFFVVDYGWSLAEKWFARQKLQKALDAPSGTPESAL